jgi:glycosyl transferase family 2
VPSVRRFLAPEPEGDVEGGTAPSLSVLVAAYQAATTVGDAVASALAQTEPPLEVIVCDDGSTDDIEDALVPYLDRILFLRKENGGEASAKNAAARAASGDFVVILDADDVFLPRRLEALAELASARPDLDILTTDATLEVDGNPVRRCYTDAFRFDVADQRRAILEQNFIFGHAAVRRARLLEIGGFDESIRWTTDWDCWIRLILSGSRAGLVAEPLALYRLNPGSLSAQRVAHIEGRLQTLAKTAARSDLTEEERGVLERSVADNSRALALARARAALLEGHYGRRRAIEVAFGKGFGIRTRLKALVSAAAPHRARRRLMTAPRETTGGLLLPPDGGVG